MNQKYKDFLTNYNGTFDYLIKVRDYYKRTGKLSKAQTNAIIKCFHRSEKEASRKVSTYVTSQQKPVPQAAIDCNIELVMKTSWAYDIRKLFHLQFPTVCITVTKILAHTDKAYQIEYAPTIGDVSVCRICGKDLTDLNSRATGVGPVCIHRYKIPFDLTMMDIATWKIKWAELVSKYGKRVTWIPKKAIKSYAGILEMKTAAAKLYKSEPKPFVATGPAVVSEIEQKHELILKRLRSLYKDSLSYGDKNQKTYLLQFGKEFKQDKTRLLREDELVILNKLNQVFQDKKKSLQLQNQSI